MTAQYHDDQFSRPRHAPAPRLPGLRHMALQTLADAGAIAADIGGALIAAGLLLGSGTLTGATIELAGCAVAALAGVGGAALGDGGALERVGRDLLDRGMLRLLPATIRRALADRLFG